MQRPILYFVRHGETDWNLEQRLQGQHDIPLNALGRVQATRCGQILARLLSATGRAAAAFEYLASPLGRARETMELMRHELRLDPADYRTDARLMEMSFGRWEGFTFAELQAREASALAARERDKWSFVLPGGESYAQLSVRVGAWYESVKQDTVIASHGGVCRALTAYLRITRPEDASQGNVRQGVIHVFAGDAVTVHE